MITSNKFLWILLISFLLLGCGEINNNPIILFTGTKQHHYRAPSITQLDDNRLIIFAEERQGGRSDSNETRIVYKIITNDIQSNTFYVNLAPNYIWSDPSSVVTNDGYILLLINRRDVGTSGSAQCRRTANNKIFQFRSKIDTINLVLDRELTSEWTFDSSYLSRISPSQGYSYNGVLYMPGVGKGPEYCGNDPLTRATDRSMVMKSTNNGSNWQLFMLSGMATNESAITFLNGHIVVISRDYTDLYTRSILYKGQRTFLDIISTRVHGGIINWNNRLWISYPKHPTNRENLTILNLTTNTEFELHSGPSGYSNLLVVDNKLAIIYEYGDIVSSGNIGLKFFQN